MLIDDAPRARHARNRLPIEVSALTVILALVLALLAGAGAALYQRSKPTHYISFSTMLIDQPFAVYSDAGDATLAKLQRLRYYYAGLVQTSVIAGPVAQQVQLPVSTVEGALTTLISPSTFTINLFAQGRNPQDSNTIAQAATNELIDYVRTSQQKVGISAVERITLTEVSNPTAGVKVSVSTKKQLVSAGVAFVVVGAAFIIVADLLRRRW